MDIQKIHLDRSKKGSIICPNCGETKHVNAIPFKTNQPINVHCQCKHQHVIQFEQRVHNRKSVRIEGKLENNTANTRIAMNITINNISLGGLQCTVDDASSLVLNDIVRLFFTIKDASQLQINAKAAIRYIRKNQIGVEFEDLDENTVTLIGQYTQDSAESKIRQEADRKYAIRPHDEALCVNAVQRELKQFFSSARTGPGVNFAGNTWDEALRQFRLTWGTRHICDHCHNVTDAESAMKSQRRCRSCNKGRYTANPKELWDIILRNSPRRERYLTLNEAISATTTTAGEFTKMYEFGFLAPIKKHLYDNTLIGTLRSAIEQSRSLGIRLSLENIRIAPSKNKIRVIRKRNFDDDAGKVTIGRSEKNDIVFYAERISRAHAYLNVNRLDKSCYLVDAGSSNGTSLNGKQLLPGEICELRDNDVIVFGGEVTVVYFSSGTFHKWLNFLAQSDGERVQSRA